MRDLKVDLADLGPGRAQEVETHARPGRTRRDLGPDLEGEGLPGGDREGPRPIQAALGGARARGLGSGMSVGDDGRIRVFVQAVRSDSKPLLVRDPHVCAIAEDGASIKVAARAAAAICPVAGARREGGSLGGTFGNLRRKTTPRSNVDGPREHKLREKG
jgi:hypothetical protein